MDVVSYKCPNCAAPLRFDIDTQDWSCPFCTSAFALEDLKDAQQIGGETPDAALQVGERYGEDATVYSCPSCGGQIITDTTTTATFCAYCHNPTVIASRMREERRPVRLIPFQLPRERAVDAVQKLCRGRPFLPKDFKDIAQKGDVTGLYVPFWLFSSDVDAHIQGEARNVRVWSDTRYRYTKTDTYRVARSARMSLRDIPADGSTKMDDALMQGLEPFDYSKMADFSMQYLSGHFAETYDVDAKEARRQTAPRIESMVLSSMRGLVNGYTQFTMNNFKSNSQNDACQYVLLPVWMLMAKYRGETYTFAMNGQTGKMVGKLPLSVGRVLGVFAALFAALTILFFVGGLFL